MLSFLGCWLNGHRLTSVWQGCDAFVLDDVLTEEECRSLICQAEGLWSFWAAWHDLVGLIATSWVAQALRVLRKAELCTCAGHIQEYI